MELILKLREQVIEGEEEQVVELVKEALDRGIDVGTIVQDGLIEAMNIVGPKMASGELFIPEVLRCAEAMKEGLEIVKPMLKAGDVKSKGKVVIGTVKGDLHDIGKNLVAMMLESSGFEVIDLGISQPEENFIRAVEEHNPDIVGVSALLTTTLPAMRDTVKVLKEKGISAKVIVGGAPVDEDFAREIGADGYAFDGAEAVLLAKKLMA